MPPVFAPGAWAGVNDAFAIARQKEREQSQLADEALRRQKTQQDMEYAQQDRQQQHTDWRNMGRFVRQAGAPTPPMPGTPSAPQRPPGPPMGAQAFAGPPGGGPPGGGQPQMAPGVPQFSAPPQVPAPMQGPGGPPGMRGAPTQPDPRAMEINRCQTDLQALEREMARPGATPDQKVIWTAEKHKVQDRLAQLTGQPPPYRSVPSVADTQGEPSAPSAPMAPPPVESQQPRPSFYQQFAKASEGMSDEELGRAVTQMGPLLRAQMTEESTLARERASDAREERLNKALIEAARHHGVTEDTGQQRADAATTSAAASAKRADTAATPGAKGWKEFRGADGTIYRDNVNAGLTQKKVDGKWMDVETGLPEDAKPANSASSGATNVRQNIVKAGVKNSLDRLSEIEKNYGNLNTSLVFGQHGDGLVSATTNALARGMLSEGQQKADAAYGSLVDEAIPVFTGGLRGSDSFRRFLMGQLPQPNDKPAARKEKLRLFRANIDGTSHTFFDKFKSSPSMWAPGEKPDAPAAASAAPANGGWKVEVVK